MNRARAITSFLLLAALVVGSVGCKKKPPPLPPQSQAPTITPEEKPPAPATPAATTPGAEPNRPQPEPTAPTETVAAPKPAAPKPKPRKPVAKKTVPAEPEKPAGSSLAEQPRSGTAEAGTQPASSGQIASLPHDEVLHQKMNTAQLLEATESNLKVLTRSLTADEQSAVQHIRSFIQQSRDATKEGDVERAYNLAVKAHLLSDGLLKR